jgi:hypothetical protein
MHKNAHNLQITSYNLSISFFVYDEVITASAQPVVMRLLRCCYAAVERGSLCGRGNWFQYDHVFE